MGIALNTLMIILVHILTHLFLSKELLTRCGPKKYEQMSIEKTISSPFSVSAVCSVCKQLLQSVATPPAGLRTTVEEM